MLLSPEWVMQRFASVVDQVDHSTVFLSLEMSSGKLCPLSC